MPAMDEASAQEGIGSRRRATRTILAVDDSRTNLHVLAHRLGQLGYLVVLADGGSQALELVSARGFDLVLVDRVMPEVSGLHVLQEIRGTRDTTDLPVIMVTSQTDPRGAIEALQAGADDYLERPYEFEELAARIERVLARADRMEELKRSNLALDARIAARAIELGEARSDLAATRAELDRFRR
ncbi:response regulator [Sphingomonas kyeonggiensis]|uniref:DNA-binding response OmpR family regulator n=1 Tax=Sphingomonas kyeonggiensis TaxID=1268553 RepID=A0A7W6NYN8_9SPHN|nr:response regulator [Sphingomonas kyeonggiensis]MBB4099804.1 DNA-binding response OmpR family regulator [Sphingomonas kyeonggiensis]